MPTFEKTRQPKTYVTDETEQSKINKFIELLELQFRENNRATLTSAAGEVVELPATLFDVLRQVAEALASGRGVSVIPQDMKLTTQQAAEFLGISRPTLIKLLESGAISFETVGRHRRITLRDLLTYRDRFRLERRTALRKAARAGQEDGLLDVTADELPPRS
jgi:excisionase family DNA binding protein